MRNLSRFRLLIPASLLTLVACPGPLPVQSSLDLYPGGCAVPQQRDPHWVVSAEAESLLVRSGYCQFHVAGMNDEQALATGAEALGPVVQLFPAPNAGRLTGDREFEGDWVNVAILARGAGQVPAEYAELGLSRTLSCLYLRRVPHWVFWRRWRAVMTDPYPDETTSSARTVCPATRRQVDGTELDVVAQQPSTSANDYPVAARFMEVTVRGAPHTSIGVRCGNTWCIAGREDQRVPRRLARERQPANVSARARNVPGWGDEQTLSVPTTEPGRPLRRSMRAAIVPSASLGDWTHEQFGQEPRHVATILVADAVPQKYATGYALTTGENPIQIVRQGTTWTALINGREHRVHYHPHPGVDVPPLARWVWNPADEQIWVRCDVGCCRVIENAS